MSSKKESGSLQKAEVSPAEGPKPKASNAMGRITPKTSPPSSKKATNPNREVHQDVLLDTGESMTSPEQIKDQWGKLQKAKAAAIEAKDYLGATAAKDALAMLKDKANQMGMSGKDLPGVVDQLLDTLDALSGGGGRKGGKQQPAANKTKSTTKSPEKPAEPSKTKKKDENAAPITANGANGSGGKGAYNTRLKRNTGRCELVAYDDLECGEDEDKPGKKMHKHHVVPDSAYRPGKRPRGGKADVRAEGNPTIGEGLSICLTQKEHDAAHKLDKRLNAASKSTRGGAVAGTMTGRQAKGISAATVEKVTGGKKGGGCKKKDIQEQLDKQTPDDKILRGEAHAGRFKNMPDAVKASQPQIGTRTR